MNSRGLAIAVFILAALTGALYWSEHHKPAADTSATAATPAPAVLKINPPDVTALTVKMKGSEPIALEKASDGKWRITAPKPYPADQDAVIGMLGSLSYLNADRVVDEKSTDRSQYGLTAPTVELDITQKGQGTRQLLIGDDTPAGGDAYAAVASDQKVFTIASYNKSGLQKNLNDLRDKSLISLSPDTLSRVEVLKKGQTIEFDRTKDGWQIVKPSASPADGDAVNNLVHMVTGARMDLSAADATGQYAHGTPVATARLTGTGGTQTLEVRKNRTDYYAKSSAVDGIYKVDSSVGQAFDKTLEDFQQKKQSPPKQ
jgi:hypothetical protein